MTLHKIHELINSEGPICTLYRDENQKLFIMGLSIRDGVQVFARSNSFLLSLFLESRISLKELFLLKMDESYLLRGNTQSTKSFFEYMTGESIPMVEGLQCANDLYELIPEDMKSGLSVNEILNLLPQLPDRGTTLLTQAREYSDVGVSFFADDSMKVVTIHCEQMNRDEHDYILCSTLQGNKLFTRLNPYSLFLFLNNRLTVKELFLCRLDDRFIVQQGNQMYNIRSFNPQAETEINSLLFASRTYRTLPTEMQVEHPLQQWRSYVDYNTISGKGILPAGFRRERNIELELINN